MLPTLLELDGGLVSGRLQSILSLASRLDNVYDGSIQEGLAMPVSELEEVNLMEFLNLA